MTAPIRTVTSSPRLPQLTGTRTQFMDLAACIGAPLEWFYVPEQAPGSARERNEVAHGKRVCRTCLVRADCLDWALETGDVYAVLGGTSPKERQRIRRRRRKAKVARG